MHTIKPFVLLGLLKDNKILLILRSNTGFSDGMYALVGGKAESGETMRSAIIREAYEEIDVTIDHDHLGFVHVFHRKGLTEELVAFCFVSSHWIGEPINKEPDKHGEIRWFPLDQLPENIVPAHKVAIESIAQKIYYSEHGWE